MSFSSGLTFYGGMRKKNRKFFFDISSVDACKLIKITLFIKVLVNEFNFHSWLMDFIFSFRKVNLFILISFKLMKITIWLKLNKTQKKFSARWVYIIPFWFDLTFTWRPLKIKHRCTVSFPATITDSAFPTLCSRLMSNKDNHGHHSTVSCWCQTIVVGCVSFNFVRHHLWI